MIKIITNVLTSSSILTSSSFLTLSEEAAKVAQTSIVQRLRKISQFGVSQTRFPLPHITRFDHSVGVAKLAAFTGKVLQNNSSHANVTDRDVLRLEIAGLLHDVGHGPFSHQFDHIIIHNTEMEHHKFAEHEMRSVALIPTIFKESGIEHTLLDVEWVQHMIAPSNLPVPESGKGFLSGIVCNPVHGLDVDKFDYLERDLRHLMTDDYWEKVVLKCEHVQKALEHVFTSPPEELSFSTQKIGVLLQSARVSRDLSTVQWSAENRYILEALSYLRLDLFQNVYLKKDFKIEFEDQVGIASTIQELNKFIQLEEDSIRHKVTPLSSPSTSPLALSSAESFSPTPNYQPKSFSPSPSSTLSSPSYSSPPPSTSENQNEMMITTIKISQHPLSVLSKIEFY